MAQLQQGLAEAQRHTQELRAQLGQEQQAKAQADAQIQSLTAEQARKQAEHQAEIASIKQVAEQTRQALVSASAEEKAALSAQYRGDLERLLAALRAEHAKAVASNTADKQELMRQLEAVRAQIAAIPPPLVAAVPVPRQSIPEITGRIPPKEQEVVPQQDITILWKSNGSTGPWLLKVMYGGTKTDYQEIVDGSGRIPYKVKYPGTIEAEIFNIIET
jgi:hypothetical protein